VFVCSVLIFIPVGTDSKCSGILSPTVIRLICCGGDLFNKIELIYFRSFPNILRYAYRYSFS
jgi:hypothetical protein